MLRRERYLASLAPFVDQPGLVKVLTGIRRGGKSVLLGQMADDLRVRVGPDRVIVLNFELMDHAGITDAQRLDAHVSSLLPESGALTYVLLDEVQEVPGFEKAVNSLRARGNVSLFITGSNAHLLSGDLATYLAGRYIETRVWPMSFAESLELRGVNVDHLPPDALTDYLTWGGMPFRFQLDGDSRRAYLRDVFNSVVLRDIIQRLGIRDATGLETVLDYAIENLGRVMSPSSISAYLKGQGRSLSADTVYSYLRALDSALLLRQVKRYDLRGKRVMSTLDKYYATDMGVLSAKRVGAGPGIGDLIENCVYGELARRNYDVYTGKTPQGEIDFVAVKDGVPRYVQVAYLLATDEVATREFRAFDALRDNYPRYVVSLDPVTQDRDGIHHLRLDNFLLNPPADLA